MDYRLSPEGRAIWKRLVQHQRKHHSGKQSSIRDAVGGRDQSGVSLFENGNEGELRRWFEDDRAARYAAAIGVDLDILRGWLATARGNAPAERLWHPSFPGILPEEARISPPLRVLGLPEPPVDGAPLPRLGDPVPVVMTVPVLVMALGECVGLVNVVIEGEPGSGRAFLGEWLRSEELPDRIGVCVSGIDTPPGTARSAATVTVTTSRWGTEAAVRLVERLVEIGAIVADRRGAADHFVDRLRDGGLLLSPTTVIAMLALAVGPGLPPGDFVSAVSVAQWSLVAQRQRDTWGDPGWIPRFWAQARLDRPGWVALSLRRDAAIDTIRHIAGERPDRARLRTLFQEYKEARRGSKELLERQLDAALAGVPAEQALDDLVAGGVFVTTGGDIGVLDPALVEAQAAAGLASRVGEIAGDPHFTWALDPSWWPVLERLGATGSDVSPLIRAWRGAPKGVQIEGALAITHLAASAPETGIRLFAGDLRAAQAIAVGVIVAAGSAMLPWVSQVNGPAEMLTRLSQRHRGILGVLEGDPWEAILERIPRPLRPPFIVGAVYQDQHPHSTHETPEGRRNWRVVSLAPWQFPPASAEYEEMWETVGFHIRSQGIEAPTREEVLEAAADSGHASSLALLCGDLPRLETEDEGGVRQEWERTGAGWLVRGVPRHNDGWRNLRWATRCQWVGRRGAPEVVAERLEHLVRHAPDGENLDSLIKAVQRIDGAIVVDVLRSLMAPPDWAPGLLPWLLEGPENARRAVRLAAFRSFADVLKAIDAAVRDHLAERSPLDSVHGFRSPLSRDQASQPAPEDSIRDRLRHWFPGWEGHFDCLADGFEPWEEVRFTAACALADLGDATLLRARAVDGPGWAWPTAWRDGLELQFQVTRINTQAKPLPLVYFLQAPPPDGEGETFLARLRANGLAMEPQNPAMDTGFHFPGPLPNDLSGFAGMDIPEWLRERIREISLLDDANAGLLSCVRTGIAVLVWLNRQWIHGTPYPRVEMSPGLWGWVRQLSGFDVLPDDHSLVGDILDPLDHGIRTEAAQALIARKDSPFLQQLLRAHVSRGLEGRPEWLGLLEDTIPRDADLRSHLWRLADPGGRDWIYLAERSASGGALPPWAKVERDRRAAIAWKECSAETDPGRRLHRMATQKAVFDGDDLDRELAGWSGAALAGLVEDYEERRIGWWRAFQLVRERLAAKSRRLDALVWEIARAVAAEPVAQAPGEPTLSVLFAPSRWRSVDELLRYLPDLRAEWVLGVWGDRDPTPVAEPLCLEKTFVEQSDIDVLPTVGELRCTWVLALAAEVLPPAHLDPDREPPGIVRAALRQRAVDADPGSQLAWITRALEADVDRGMLWRTWAVVRPKDALRWLRDRLASDPAAVPSLIEVLSENLDAVEGVEPGIRRWLTERVYSGILREGDPSGLP